MATIMGLVRLIFLLALIYFGARLVRRWLGTLGTLGRSGPRPPPPDTARGDNRAPQTRNAYDVLEVSSNASQAEIRAAYQRLVRQYHPDRVADMGPELRALAEERTKEINQAYNRLRQR